MVHRYNDFFGLILSICVLFCSCNNNGTDVKLEFSNCELGLANGFSLVSQNNNENENLLVFRLDSDDIFSDIITLQETMKQESSNFEKVYKENLSEIIKLGSDVTSQGDFRIGEENRYFEYEIYHDSTFLKSTFILINLDHVILAVTYSSMRKEYDIKKIEAIMKTLICGMDPPLSVV